jgi:hypothetical protein
VRCDADEAECLIQQRKSPSAQPPTLTIAGRFNRGKIRNLTIGVLGVGVWRDQVDRLQPAFIISRAPLKKQTIAKQEPPVDSRARVFASCLIDIFFLEVE